VRRSPAEAVPAPAAVEPGQVSSPASRAREPAAPGSSPDLAEVWGHEAPKRALEVAAAGGHSLLLVGPTGVGKSLLARCLAGLLPPLGPEETREVAEIYARAGEPPPPGRPVRCPGRGLTPAGLLGHSLRGVSGASGGGRCNSRPGEVDLARHGVLILDDLAALGRATRQALCEALDVAGESSFQLVAALRPCPCGGLAKQDESCACTPALIRRHLDRIDGALLDRIALSSEVPALRPREIARSGEASAAVAARVAAARRLRGERRRERLTLDALDPGCRSLLARAVERLGLSPRALGQTVQVARTIADLAGSGMPRGIHLAEAIQYSGPAATRRALP
jgi:magnesium chelatase family protein